MHHIKSIKLISIFSATATQLQPTVELDNTIWIKGLIFKLSEWKENKPSCLVHKSAQKWLFCGLCQWSERHLPGPRRHWRFRGLKSVLEAGKLKDSQQRGKRAVFCEKGAPSSVEKRALHPVSAPVASVYIYSIVTSSDSLSPDRSARPAPTQACDDV